MPRGRQLAQIDGGRLAAPAVDSAIADVMNAQAHANGLAASSAGLRFEGPHRALWPIAAADPADRRPGPWCAGRA